MVGETDPFLPSILILDPLKTPEHLSGNIGHGNIGQKWAETLLSFQRAFTCSKLTIETLD